jgi:hypothetical protein
MSNNNNNVEILLICLASLENQLYEKLCETFEDFLELQKPADRKFCNLDEVKQYLPICSPSAQSRGTLPRLGRWIGVFSSNISHSVNDLIQIISRQQFGTDGTERVIAKSLDGNNNNDVIQQQQPQQFPARRDRSPPKPQSQQQQQQQQFQRAELLPTPNNTANNNNNNSGMFQHHQALMQTPQQQQQLQQPVAVAAAATTTPNMFSQMLLNNQQQQLQQQAMQEYKVFLGYSPILSNNKTTAPNHHAVAESIQQQTGIVPKQVYVVGHKCAVFVHLNNKQDEDLLLSKGFLTMPPNWKFTIKPAFQKPESQTMQQPVLNPLSNTASSSSLPSIPNGFNYNPPQQNQNQQQSVLQSNIHHNNNHSNNNVARQDFSFNKNMNQHAAASPSTLPIATVSTLVANTTQPTSTILFSSLPSGTSEELLFYRLLPHEPSLMRMIENTNCAAVTFENSQDAGKAFEYLKEKTLKGQSLSMRFV